MVVFGGVVKRLKYRVRSVCESNLFLSYFFCLLENEYLGMTSVTRRRNREAGTQSLAYHWATTLYKVTMHTYTRRPFVPKLSVFGVISSSSLPGHAVTDTPIGISIPPDLHGGALRPAAYAVQSSTVHLQYTRANPCACAPASAMLPPPSNAALRPILNTLQNPNLLLIITHSTSFSPPYLAVSTPNIYSELYFTHQSLIHSIKYHIMQY